MPGHASPDRPGSATMSPMRSTHRLRDGCVFVGLSLAAWLLLSAEAAPEGADPSPAGHAGSRVVASAASAASAWTLVALPDTQKYVADPALAPIFEAQTRWIVDSLDGRVEPALARNIAFVSHLGDIVDDGSSPEQWALADAAMALLDGDPADFPEARLPYAAVIGNHDYAVVSDRQSGSERYREHFGSQRYVDRSDGRSYAWYGGSSPDGLGHYQRFEAGGYAFLHLALPWEVEGSVDDPASALGWARDLLAANPSRPTIISTHSYVWDEPGAEGRTQAPQSEGGNSGEAIFAALVQPFPQVFMVLNGHWHRAGGEDDGEWEQVSFDDDGLPIYELLADYQDRARGGDGWLRLIDFLPGQGEGGRDRIAVSTFSPSRAEGAGDFQPGPRSEFHFDLDFERRFRAALGGRAAIPAPELLSAYRADWHYLDQAEPPPPGWREPDFDPAAAGWPLGPALLGYGDPDVATTLDYGPDADHKRMHALFTRRFELDPERLARIERVSLSLRRDDGAAVYLNGRELARDNLAPEAGLDEPALASVSGGEERAARVFQAPAAGLLRPGSNLLSAEVHQRSPTSSDLAFDLALMGLRGPAAPARPSPTARLVLTLEPEPEPSASAPLPGAPGERYLPRLGR